MATAIDRGDAPASLVVGGFGRRRVLAFLIGALVVSAGTAWVANVEPLRVDTTAVGVRPIEMVAASVEATSPQGDTFTQYTIPIGAGESISFVFWLHNTAPFPITVTDAGARTTWGPTFADARIGPAEGSRAPSRVLPYTIDAGAYAAIELRYRFAGCLEEGTSTTLGSVPVSFRMLGVVPRSTSVTMPMTIELTGHAGATCTAG